MLTNPTNLNSNNVEQFRQALAHYLDVPHCFLTSSGRAALFLLLSALKRNAEPNRRTVILPAYTCPSLAKVILDAGLQVRLVDLAANAFSYETTQLASMLDTTVLAVLCVHPFGIAQEIASLSTMAHQAGAVVIEDAAQAMGARVAGRALGTQGDYGIYSLGPGKALSTGGGGAVTVNRPTEHAATVATLTADYEQLPASHYHHSLVSLARLGLFTLTFQPNFWWLATRLGAQRVGENENSWGYRLSRLTPAQASVGVQQLACLDRYNQARRARALQMIDGLRSITSLQFFPDSRGGAIYLRLPLLTESASLREQFYQRLWTAGIGAGRLYQKTIGEFFPQLNLGNFPNAESLAQRLLTLPTHHYLSDNDVERIIRTFKP